MWRVTRYSPLNQINAANVSQLHRVWTFHMSPDLRGGAGPTAETMEAHGPMGRVGELSAGCQWAHVFTTPYNRWWRWNPRREK